MIQWNTFSWWQRACIFSALWSMAVIGCGGGLLLLLGSRLTESDRYDIQSAFLTIGVAGLCALWLGYWMGRKSMPPSSKHPEN